MNAPVTNPPETPTDHAPSDDAETQRATFLALLERFDDAMLVTHQEDGSIHARPMRIARIGAGGDLWFVTASDTQKVEEIENTMRCAVTMQRDRAFLGMSGLAEIVTDAALVRELWQPAWRVWFPEGPTSANLCLVHVVPDRAEYWDNTGWKGLKFLLASAIAALRGRAPDDAGPALHGRVEL